MRMRTELIEIINRMKTQRQQGRQRGGEEIVAEDADVVELQAPVGAEVQGAVAEHQRLGVGVADPRR